MSAPRAPERVLIVDDEPDLLRLLVFNLEAMGFATETATTGGAGLEAAARSRPAVVVLDLMLPDIPGAEVCRRLRADPDLTDVGVIMLTARGDEYDRVLGFEVGADDYVVKPYSVKEVCLRVRALARRTGERRAAAASPAASPAATQTFRWQGLEVDVARHRVTADGVELPLRPLEFKLLALFLEQPGIVHRREDILKTVWGEHDIGVRTIDVHIRRLRERLGRYGDVIETVHGVGYRGREA
jgi:two-component system phosphate regulon response regulator PhoB